MDYARAIVEFFVERRGKGSAVSSADEQLVMRWEDEGVPVSVVFAGIDAAFERKAEPPKSLSDCGRWVRAAFKKWSGGEVLGSAAHSGSAAVETGAVMGSSTPVATVEETLIAELEARGRSGHVALRQAVDAVLAEVRELAARGPLAPDVIAVIDEAIAETAIAALPPEERRAVIERVDARLRGRSMSGAAWAAARAREIVDALAG